MEAHTDSSDNELPIVRTHVTNFLFDTRRWDSIVLRNDDVLVGSYLKSGTTWTIQLVQSLLHSSQRKTLDSISPWIEVRLRTTKRLLKMVESQQRRRCLKHHLMPQNLPVSSHELATHIYIARDGRDVCLSLHDFHKSFRSLFLFSLRFGSYDGPVLSKADPDKIRYFEKWLREDGSPFWGYWEHIRSWWKVRKHPRVLLLHYAALQRDPVRETRRIYDFLRMYGVVVPGEPDVVVEAAARMASFKCMKQRASSTAPGGGVTLKRGAKSFFKEGPSRSWKNVLPENLVLEYEETASRELGEECADWLATGTYLN